MPAIGIINADTCKVCGACSEVCPNRIMTKDDSKKMVFRPDREGTCIKCGQCMAVCPTGSIIINGLSYSRDFAELPQSRDYTGAFMDLIATRRAIRAFKDKPVPRELLEKIVNAIRFAPPSFPPIKTELVVVQDTAMIRKALPYMIDLYDFLVKAIDNPDMSAMIKANAGEEKFRVMINHMIPVMKMRLPELKAGTEDTITRNAPAMILFHADREAENFREDIYIALTYGFLAAHALGLGGSAMDIIPPPIERNNELRKMFSIPDGNIVVGSIIVGYPKYKYRRLIKRELKSVTWI